MLYLAQSLSGDLSDPDAALGDTPNTQTDAGSDPGNAGWDHQWRFDDAAKMIEGPVLVVAHAGFLGQGGQGSVDSVIVRQGGAVLAQSSDPVPVSGDSTVVAVEVHVGESAIDANGGDLVLEVHGRPAIAGRPNNFAPRMVMATIEAAPTEGPPAGALRRPFSRPAHKAFDRPPGKTPYR